MYDALRERVDFWGGLYVLIGFTSLIGWLGQGVCFAYYSQNLTYKTRRKVLDVILRQDLTAFTGKEHATASLTNILSNSASHLQGLSGVILGTILVISTTLIAGLVIALIMGWKLALVCALTIPIQLGCGLLRLKCLELLERHSRKAYEASSAYACEYSGNIKTIASLTMEDAIKREYHTILEEQRKKSTTFITRSSVLYAASRSFTYVSGVLAFWYGAQLVVNDHYTMFQFYVCYATVVSGAFSAGSIFSFAPDIGKARDGTIAIKELFESAAKSRSAGQRGISQLFDHGSIQLENVSFSYPNRPGNKVLDGISLDIQSGQYIGIVGASGSGKSTIIALLERFYEPDNGRVMVSGDDATAWKIDSYRSQLALVGQTPILFSGTIRENITYGVNGEHCSDERIVQACRDANIYDFVASLP